MPIAGTNFKYSFHADLEFDTLSQFNKVKQQIEGFTEQVKVFGEYKSHKVS